MSIRLSLLLALGFLLVFGQLNSTSAQESDKSKKQDSAKESKEPAKEAEEDSSSTKWPDDPKGEDIDKMMKVIRGWDYNNHPDKIDEEDLQYAARYLKKGLFPENDTLELKQRITHAKSAIKTMKANRLTIKINKAKEAARKEITKVVEAAYTAISAAKAKDLAALADWEQVKLNTQGKGVCISSGNEKPTPLTHAYSIKRIEDEERGDRINIEYGEMRETSAMKSEGLKLMLGFYSPKGEVLDESFRLTSVTYELMKNNDEVKSWDLYGEPKALLPDSPVASDHYYAIMALKTKGGSYKPKRNARLYVGGKWGEPAKILWIWAPFAPELLRHHRDEAYYKDKELGEEKSNAKKAADEKDGEDNSKYQIAPLDTSTYKKDLKFNLYGILPNTKLREALDHVNSPADPKKSHIKLLQDADDEQKLKMLAALADLLVKAHKIGGKKADNVVSTASELGSKGLKGWKYLDETWIDDLYYNRIRNAHEMAFRYRQAYDKIVEKNK